MNEVGNFFQSCREYIYVLAAILQNYSHNIISYFLSCTYKRVDEHISNATIDTVDQNFKDALVLKPRINFQPYAILDVSGKFITEHLVNKINWFIFVTQNQILKNGLTKFIV